MPTEVYGLPAGTGPEQLLLFDGTIGGNTGAWEPVTLVDSSGAELTDSGSLKVKVQPKQLLPATGSKNTAALEVLVNPTAGTTLRLHSYRLVGDLGVSGQVVFTLQIGSLVIDSGPLIANQQVAVNLGDGNYLTANVDDDLTLTLDGSGQKVWWTARYDEV